MPQNKIINDLVLYRERIGYSQTQVAHLLGLGSTTLLSKVELGHRLPSLGMALKLAILYRVPVDFLYSKLYASLRDEIRAREEGLSLSQRNAS